MKITELAPGVAVIPGNTNVGVITDSATSPQEVYLVDSGCTELEGDFVLDELKQFFEQRHAEFHVKAIINTHFHPDHCGANRLIQDETGCEIWAAQLEQAGMVTPILQGCLLWGGYPPHELRTLYYQPEQSVPTKIIGTSDVLTLRNGTELSFTQMPGHSFQCLCIICKVAGNKKFVFAGDAIFPREEISKYWIPFNINPMQFMESLEVLNTIPDIDTCIPSHGGFIKGNLAETIELNKIAILETKNCILEIIGGKKLTQEQIVKAVADRNGLNMALSHYVLIGSTIRSYLAALHDAGEVRFAVEENVLYFYRPQ